MVVKPLEDIGVVPSFFAVMNKAAMTLMYRFVCGHTFSFF